RVEEHSADEKGNVTAQSKVYDTTVGRALLYDIVPKMLPFEMVNKAMDKKAISTLINDCYRRCGLKDTVIFADQLMYAGFARSTSSGASIGVEAFVIPQAKSQIIAEAEAEVEEIESQYASGLVTQGEKYNKVVDVWSRCSDLVADEMMKGISTIREGEPINSVWMMAHSGARGSAAQIKQLAGMRGLMAKPSGEIIETPIISSFKEGLNVLEYFNSTHGARKGLADTALKTANSGYLTRRLVDVAQDCIVNETDCGTSKGLTIRPVMNGSDVVETLYDRILGRVMAEDMVDLATGDVIVAAGEMVTEEHAERMEASGVDQAIIRSALLCEAQTGICGQCYGRDLARGTSVNIGEAVGVIAAQSIGEPGTQLTMRTFHVGGAAQRGAEQSNIEAAIGGKVKLENEALVKDREGNQIVMSRNTELLIMDEQGRERERHRLPYGGKLFGKAGKTGAAGDVLIEWDPYTMPIIAEMKGTANYVDLVDGISVREVTDDATGISSREVVDWKASAGGQNLRPRITLRDDKGEVLTLSNGLEARYFMSAGAILSVESGAEVQAGDVLARIPRESSKTRDITGGLPRVAELFEARKPKDFAVISESDGRVEFGNDYKAKRRIKVTPVEGDGEPVEYLLPKGRPLAVNEGDIVRKGDLLLDGSPVPHDILAILGVEQLAAYLVKEIQDVYRLQGVKINDKHIEVIVRQMLQKVEVTDAGDSTFLIGEQVDREEFASSNASLEAEGLRPAVAHPVLLGITKASLQTRSFISAASFQETTRVLTEASVSGRQDTLDGLKENVIVGRLIPAGTGSVMKRLRRIAADRDRVIMEERAAATPALEDAAAESADGFGATAEDAQTEA
ncbi:MAG: DNA-directed RNA polymerase subunit beta', partial [SAR116 cluster bacterium]|nr:DNA-directed RNA polymerase subunit beta' [SAR116 cluster bacterium]